MEENKQVKKSEAALREERILEYWKENKVFEKTLNLSEGRPEFIFYEGPPGANGRPHIGHLPSRAFKDAVPRYKTMRGFHVRRKGGWDTHGLPVELQVEKKLGLNSKKGIEQYGVKNFNQKCKESVWEYLNIWNIFTERMGYWVDQKNAYVTYHNDYIESLWNIVKQINEQDLLYKDYKVVPWCPRCGTALSSHELAQGYETVKDLSVTVKFKVRNEPNTYVLAWTTTPWTLPGNVALAVGKDIDYVKIKVNPAAQTEAEFYFLAKARLSVISEPYEVVEEIKGAGLVGLEYEPVFPFLVNTISDNERPKLDKAYRVHQASFVTTEDGTGVVHTAVMYGQDDFVLGNEVGLPKHHLVGLDGKFSEGTGIFEGRFVKDEEVAVDIIKDLAGKGLLYKKEKYEHTYPHCWRCKTPLIYYARDSWYIKMSDPKIKKALIEENKNINWEPAHIKDGRFGEWLREIKDWAISRERYWGTPLPVWSCESCKELVVLGSLKEIRERTKKSNNRYFTMRHGQAENNVVSGPHHKDLEHNSHLTETGKTQTRDSIKKFQEKVDLIISSPFARAKETAEIVAQELGYPIENIVFDKRVQEWETSSYFEGKDRIVFDKYYDLDYLDKPEEVLPDGESFAGVVKRVGEFIYELNSKYSGKNILIVSHGGATNALTFVLEGMAFYDLSTQNPPFKQPENAEIREVHFSPLPHNESYELDLHRPYIDEIELYCNCVTDSGQACGGKLIRTKEVMDVWFDSGAMPFAQDHYPFENKKWVEGQGYPADFISEGMDQTRGWFYTLHAVGVLMGKGKAFKNVICLGLVNDAKGQKMSKSLGNVVEPLEAMEKFGADTIRLWMYSVNQPGESKNFDEKTVALLSQQVFGLLYNVLAFYELYRDRDAEKHTRPKSENVLDGWILARLDELLDSSTEYIENYKLLEPVRAIRDFIGDLSTWYLRRSRDRIKDGDGEAKATLYFVLRTLVKILAPFAPFAAEDIWLKLKNSEDVLSVHLETWPETKKSLLSFGGHKQEQVLEYMRQVREIVSLGLEARQKTGIKVRQPLAKIEVKDLDLPPAYIELIKEELNVKEVKANKELTNAVLLDVRIDAELEKEGSFRELVRALQDQRKKIGLTPNDIVDLVVETDSVGQNLLKEFEAELKKTVLVAELTFAANDGETIQVDKQNFRVKIEK